MSSCLPSRSEATKGAKRRIYSHCTVAGHENMHMRSFVTVLLRMTTAALLSGRVLSAQVSTDIIRGRVTDVEAHALQGVDVKATSYSGQVTKTATTDKNGRFTIMFINGEGDYWLELRKLGLQAKRFQIKKVGDEEIMIADARMSSSAMARGGG